MSSPVPPLRPTISVQLGARAPADKEAAARRKAELAAVADAAPWRASWLLHAPHRLGFFLASCVLVLASLWWALVQVDRATGALHLAGGLPQIIVHGTVMVLGFVSAGLLTLRQAVPVIFGCNIGTTVTAQLLAFRLEDVRGLVLLAGLLLCFACAGRKGRAIGRAVFAFGLLFEGIADMGTAMEPLAQSPVFVHWLGRVRQHPWLGLLAGLGMTLTVQSSSATIALLQNFAARPGLDGSSLLGLAGALPVLLGFVLPVGFMLRALHAADQ